MFRLKHFKPTLCGKRLLLNNDEKIFCHYNLVYKCTYITNSEYLNQHEKIIPHRRFSTVYSDIVYWAIYYMNFILN